MNEELKDALTELETRKLEKERANAAKKSADLAHGEQERKVLNMFEGMGVDSIKIDGILFSKAETVYANIQDVDEFLTWAETQDETLWEPKPRKAILSELVREKLDNGEANPPGVGFYRGSTSAIVVPKGRGYYNASVLAQYLKSLIEIRPAQTTEAGHLNGRPVTRRRNRRYLNGVEFVKKQNETDSKALDRWARGEILSVRLDKADKLLMRFNHSLTEFEDWAYENNMDPLWFGDTQ